MRNPIVIFGIVLVLVVSVLAVSQFGKGRDAVAPLPDEHHRLRVAATFYPLAEFARQVGGDNVEVSTVVPGGVEPHDYEPTPQDIVAVQSADVFLYNGAGLDPWAERLRPELEAKGVAVVMMGEAVGPEALHGDEEEPGRDGTEEHGHEGGVDPHFWLDPVLARKEAEAIRDALVRADEARKDEYAAGAEAYGRELDALDEAYRRGLASCRQDTVVTSHDAFGYLAARYGFKAMPVAGLSPEEEPSPRRLADLSRAIRRQGIRYIFFETLVSPRLAETLARETGAKTLVFNPLEGLTDEELRTGEDYVSVMRSNLGSLRTALDCE
jgi:zinc transport system substrate-binding protein